MKQLVRRPDTGYLDSNLWIPKSAVNEAGVKKALTFQMFDTTKMWWLFLFKETDHHIIAPREFYDPSQYLFPVVDVRPQNFQRVAIKSRIQLDHMKKNGALVPTGKTVQREAMAALLSGRGGILQLACGLGKTVVALDFIARRGVPALIVLDTQLLLEQWEGEASQLLDIPGGIGLIQGDKFDWKKPVVLTTYQTLANRAATLPEEVRRWFGTIVWDEAHHVAAPVFSRSADLFYGYRLGLTATPKREDGMHVVHNYHLGPVLYKNLHQDLRPRITFEWTGVSLNLEDPQVAQAVNDKNGELHIGKIAGFLGRKQERLDFTVQRVQRAVSEGRKVIVLSKSVDALVNLLCAWNGRPERISDIPYPQPQEVGETLPPIELEPKTVQRLTGKRFEAIERYHQARLANDQRAITTWTQKFWAIEQTLQSFEVFKKLEALYEKRRNAFVKELLTLPSNAGLMIRKVKPKERMKMLREKQVTFAIMKYGKEGLDDANLETIIVNEPASNQGGVQQIMGRVLRKTDWDKDPELVFLEDDIGPFIGMCNKIRKLLREWPLDEGGPYDSTNVGRTNYAKVAKKWSTRKTTVRGPG